MDKFFKKHTPKTLDSVIGNKKGITEIREWAKDYKKPLFIYGQTGIGKTLCANLIAIEKEWSIMQTDASDIRDKESIRNIIQVASTTNTLFAKTRLILIDEVDSVADKRGSDDYGFFSEFEKIVDKAKQPIIFIANNPYDNKKIRPLFEKCTQIKFDLPNSLSILKFAKEVCEIENIDYDLVSLKQLVDNSNNDIRALLIDLHTTSLIGKLTLEDANFFSDRKRDEDIFKVLPKIFYPKDFYETKKTIDTLNIDWELLFLWIDENLPKQYKNINNLANAFDSLSKADINKARIRASHWILFKYVLDYITIGIGYSKTEREINTGFNPYQFPRLLKTLTTKNKILQKSVVEKMAQKTHCSKRIVYRDYLPFISIIAQTNKNNLGLINYFGLSLDEMKYLGAKINQKQYDQIIVK